jgi:Sulfotransferase domain
VTGRVGYRSWMSDNLRWDALRLREGDIVISAPSKCGVTWTQRLVSLLVFDGPDLPGPLTTVSPWLDGNICPIEEIVATLDAQHHRRFIKTHTPLDGLVLDDRVTYIAVGRDPRDAAMSELHQWGNMNLHRMRALNGAPGLPPPEAGDRPSPIEAFRDWMEGPIMPPDGMPPGAPPQGMGFAPRDPAGFLPPPRPGFKPPVQGMGSLASILNHFGSVWHRRHLPNVAMFHYADFQLDLVGELVRLAAVLGYPLDRERAERLTEHASLAAMRARAYEFAPNSTEGMWHSDERFFRAGARGEWLEFFNERVYRRYYDRINQLAPPDLLAWAHEGRQGCDPAV